MAYDRKKLFEQALEVIGKNRLFFIEDVIAMIGISKQTFYDFYPVGSDELDQIKTILLKNKAETKVVLRKKWYDGENPTLSLALYKMICTEEERQMLSMQEVKITKGGDQPLFDLGRLSKVERELWYKLYNKAVGKVETIDVDYEEVKPKELEE